MAPRVPVVAPPDPTAASSASPPTKRETAPVAAYPARASAAMAGLA